MNKFGGTIADNLNAKQRLTVLDVELKQRLSALRTQVVAVAYFDKLGERIAAAAKEGRQPAQLLASVRQLEVIAIELAEVEKDPQTALGRQTTLNKEQLGQEQVRWAGPWNDANDGRPIERD